MRVVADTTVLAVRVRTHGEHAHRFSVARDPRARYVSPGRQEP
jgi:hypothetical protein